MEKNIFILFYYFKKAQDLDRRSFLDRFKERRINLPTLEQVNK